MASPPTEFRLTLTPSRRFEAIDVNERVAVQAGDLLKRYRRTLYCSLHTTAGYLEQSLAGRMLRRDGRLAQFFDAFHAVFPRTPSTATTRSTCASRAHRQQKAVEPRTRDSHLTFIGAGMRNCVTYRTSRWPRLLHRPRRHRQGRAPQPHGPRSLAYDKGDAGRATDLRRAAVPPPVDSINLADPKGGSVEQVNEIAAEQRHREGPRRHRAERRGAQRGLTVNEYETLLMRHDLIEVLKDPLRFAAIKGAHMLDDPRAIPGKTLNYAKYDLVRSSTR